MTPSLSLRTILAVVSSFMFGAANAQTDFTSQVGGAACDDASWWYLLEQDASDHDVSLQCDTWSSRGSRDGSGMTTPFMEYWQSKDYTTTAAHLPSAKIRHQTISGLPKGQYEVTMRVRCYCETYNGYTQPSGITLYANGQHSSDVCEGAASGTYSGGLYTVSSPTVTCEVGDEGTLDLGLDVDCYDTEVSWVAWKDVTLTCLSTIATPLADGSYALRHKSTGLYLNAGGNWGTEAVLGIHPLLVDIQSTGDDDQYFIDTPYDNEHDGFLGLSDRLFVDHEFQTFEIVGGNNGYTIKSSTGYLGYEGTGSQSIKRISPNLADGTSASAQWELVSYKQLVEALLASPAGSTADATFLISNPRYDRNHNNNAWQGTSFNTGGNDGSNDGLGNFCAEVWNTNFDVYQTLVNIPNGTYRLRAQGFYRYNNNGANQNDVAAETHANGSEKLYAQLYANNVSTPLQSIASESGRMSSLGLSGSSAGLPYSMQESANAFTAGLYSDNQLEVTVTDHNLTIGVRKTMKDGCDWTIWDNFELTLLTTGDNSDYDINGGNTPSDDPADLTQLIQNASCDNARGWTGSPTIGGAWNNRNAEKYNTTFDVYQTLKGLNNGWYRLSVQGFYRYGDYHEEQHKSYYGGGYEENDANNMYAMYTIPYAVISRKLGLERPLATLYANNVEAGLCSPFDYAQSSTDRSGYEETELGFVPNTQDAASQAFSAGEYPVELLVPVTDGTLRLGIHKSFGYKYDWTCWDNFQLHYLGTSNLIYATGIDLESTSLSLALHEKRQLNCQATPSDASDKTLTWRSSDSGVVSIDDQGLATATGTGTATLYVTAKGSNGGTLTRSITVSVSSATASSSNLIINEILVSNIDQFVDPSNNYGGYVELYNPTSTGVSLRNLYVSDDPTNLLKSRLNTNSGAVPAQGFGLIWFDHNDVNSSQANFKLDMDGGTIYLSDEGGNILASQTYPPALSRTAYARTTDGGTTWNFTAYPTPGASNSGSREWVSATAYTRLALPEVSHDSQLFSSPFTLSVTIPAGATLYYTTDGSTPTDSHGEVSSDGLIAIDGTTILRLRLYQSGALPSAVRTCSYILRDKDYMLPVLSVVSDPVNFFDDKLGVFVTGTNGSEGSGISFRCNWNMEWDRPVAVAYIPTDGSAPFHQEASLKRFGGWSRSWYPYNFKLNAEKQYEGLNYFAYQPFPMKGHLKHKVWQARNGGNDLLCRIKDVAVQQIIMTSGFHLDCQDYQPVHSFINGQYIGMLNLREPSNKHFALANYGIDADEQDQLELGGGISVNAGTDEAFNQWLSLSYSANDEETYQQICDMVDIDEFINYMAAQIFLGGDDWPGNNCKAFKGNDGKWHIVLFDVDQALRFNAYAFNHIDGSTNCPLVRIFTNMLSNATFRKQFIDTFCLVGGSVFEPTRSSAIIDRLSSEMDPALAFEGLSTNPTANYMKAALTASRRDTMMEGLANWSRMQISSSAQRVKLSANIDDATLQLNGLDIPTARFDGTVFAPAVIKATAPEGYTFKGWVNDRGRVVSTTEEYDLSGLGALTLTATYEPMTSDADLLAAIAMPIKVNEVSAGNSVNVSDWWKKSDWIELYNNTDSDIDAAGLYLSDDPEQPMKYQIGSDNSVANTVIPARGHLVVWADGQESLTELHADFKLSNTDGCMVLVSSSDDFVSRNSDYFAAHPDLSAFVDGMTYMSHRGDQTVVRYPDGGTTFYRTWRPTFSSRNTLLSSDEAVGTDRNLMVSDEAFTLALSAGWNWVSHPLSTSVGTGSLSPYVQRIVASTHEAYNDSHYGMTGTLKSMEAGQLYKVEMRSADTFTSTAPHCRGNMAINLKPGWNWVGYTADGSQSLTAALADYLAEEGEMLLSQDGFATYSGGAWSGSLTTLSAGKGYLLHANNAKTLRFRTPNVRVNIKSKAHATLAQRYGADSHAYPNVMGVIAELRSADGTPACDERLTLVAYSGGECRGVSAWVGDLAYLTLYGDGGEPLTYRAIDSAGTQYAIVESDRFAQGVEGTPSQPRQLTLGDVISESPATDQIATGCSRHGAPAGYYSLSGMLLSHHAATLPAGIYIVKHDDGTYQKIHIKP